MKDGHRKATKTTNITSPTERREIPVVSPRLAPLVVIVVIWFLSSPFFSPVPNCQHCCYLLLFLLLFVVYHTLTESTSAGG